MLLESSELDQGRATLLDDVGGAEQGTKHVEVFLGCRFAGLLDRPVDLAREPEVVSDRVSRRKVDRDEFSPLGQDRIIFEVDDGREEPLEEGAVRFAKQGEGLPKVPTGKIEVIVIDLEIDGIGRGENAEVAVFWPHVEKANIVIAVSGGKPPGTTSRFAGIEDLESMFFLELVKLLQNFFRHSQIRVLGKDSKPQTDPDRTGKEITPLPGSLRREPAPAASLA